MLEEKRSIKRVSCNTASTETTQYRRGKACIFEHLTPHFSSVSLDHAVDYVGEEGFIVAQEARRRGEGGGVICRRRATICVEVELVDAVGFDASTGAAGGHAGCASSHSNVNGTGYGADGEFEWGCKARMIASSRYQLRSLGLGLGS